MKAKDGNLMTDAYLRKQLAKFDKRFDSVYKAASGYIHHSEKAFYSVVSVKEMMMIMQNKRMGVDIQIQIFVAPAI
jgi:hypothetical protein